MGSMRTNKRKRQRRALSNRKAAELRAQQLKLQEELKQQRLNRMYPHVTAQARQGLNVWLNDNVTQKVRWLLDGEAYFVIVARDTKAQVFHLNVEKKAVPDELMTAFRQEQQAPVSSPVGRFF